jgi:4-hydroxybenzoate polyprenyltransferase
VNKYAMKLTGAFLRLIRWPNLAFIAVTQALFYYSFIYPHYDQPVYGGMYLFTPGLLFLLVTASVLIAAAGYIINDYFDLNIDKINKPDRLIVEKLIRRRWAIVWHLLLSVIGVLLSLYISYRVGNWLVAFFNLITVLLLWFYSTTFKKKLLVGNVIISVLTAWVILVLYVSEMQFTLVFTSTEIEHQLYIRQLFKISILYSGFAFIISLIREVVKDIEDIQGDLAFGCRTMPIVWGIPVSKVFVATWLAVLISALVIILFYVLQLKWWWFALYAVAFIVLPLLSMLPHLYKAALAADYHRISSRLKWVMLAGILSMILFKFYHTKTIFGF